MVERLETPFACGDLVRVERGFATERLYELAVVSDDEDSAHEMAPVEAPTKQ